MREGAVQKTNHLQAIITSWKKASSLQNRLKTRKDVLPRHHPLPRSVKDVRALGRYALLEALHVGLELLHVGSHGGLHRRYEPQLARREAGTLLHDLQVSLNFASRAEVVDCGPVGAEDGVQHEGAR
eukprot:CAMPEP_0115565190 /NCGR_PEP_ID=MMETSP0271-20121206/102941_1 /TAXON_ID=71861 /ORGANISM="Scrippsiella trochoidea, Strain CCMP3099" /LENGTH=126 /DNA_ID=CAMNT_0002999459 /DNA_START=79 /DNA_END=459 /DNA_ORIENTATION=-